MSKDTWPPQLKSGVGVDLARPGTTYIFIEDPTPEGTLNDQWCIFITEKVMKSPEWPPSYNNSQPFYFGGLLLLEDQAKIQGGWGSRAKAHAILAANGLKARSDHPKGTYFVPEAVDKIPQEVKLLGLTG